MMKALETIGKMAGLFILVLFLTGVFMFISVDPIMQQIAMILSVFIFYYIFEKKRGWPLGFKQEKKGRHFLGGALFGIILMSLVFSVIWLLGGIRINGLIWDQSIFQELSYWLILFIGVGFAEELFSRGYNYGLVQYLFSTKLAVIVSSVFFALMHSFNKSVWTNPLPMVELILAGVLLALVREVTGGLWAPIGFHFTWNFFQGPIFGFEVSGLPMSSLIQTEATGNSLISGGQFGAEGSIISILITSLAIIFVYVVGKNRYKNSH
ncbi:CPBP family intramembrane glutamic endopeptidase [Thermoflavimicrobium daqui]|uniref:CAAX prenyl protease 2/Lysostaphin resistance protein A-like domain-containing protein n=1 Tax=Thermoflavimicrobium daqui TaxID=2137476 RepID=A0A364KA23_9BACL|nr:type II CAAX endopeptidase family protein [Thermoflavimicrobium daqui]RAL27072.1 hypothetical protein DL897_03295 [Thermoflavimicrobium daqui]